ncbi:MAG: twin-arginine translocase subunit TatC [Parcubacteria group bacterium]|nr:twin-arginine translocase subunit TatC [Parcubacteria group bacterium]
MSLVGELKTMATELLKWLFLVLVSTIILFSIGIEKVNIGKYSIPLPVPEKHSAALYFFETIRNDLMPEGVDLIVTNPASAFVSQILIAFLLSVIITVPYALYIFTRYFSPAFYISEKRAILKVLIPSAILFIGGSLFAYFFIIPPIFSFLYEYAALIGATSFFSVNEFIALVFSLVIVVGILFLLPVFMFLMNYMGIISEQFWREKWRYAFLGFLILSAVVTPDGSGVSMVLLSVPLIVLYGVGIIISHNSRLQVKGFRL